MVALSIWRGRHEAAEYQRLSFLARFYTWMALRGDRSGPWRCPRTGGRHHGHGMEGAELARVAYMAAARLYLGKARALREACAKRRALAR